TASATADIGPTVDEAFGVAGSSHRGPAFVDVPMDQFFDVATRHDIATGVETIEPDMDALRQIAALLAAAHRPVLILGTDVWADSAEEAALRFVTETGIPVIANG